MRPVPPSTARSTLRTASFIYGWPIGSISSFGQLPLSPDETVQLREELLASGVFGVGGEKTLKAKVGGDTPTRIEEVARPSRCSRVSVEPETAQVGATERCKRHYLSVTTVVLVDAVFPAASCAVTSMVITLPAVFGALNHVMRFVHVASW